MKVTTEAIQISNVQFFTNLVLSLEFQRENVTLVLSIKY